MTETHVPTTPPVIGLALEGPRPQNRWTIAFRVILAIPHWIWASLLGFVAFFAIVIAWIAAIFLGRVPDGLRLFIARYLQYYTRIYAYGYYLLTDKYPPFALDDVDYPLEALVPPSGRLNRVAVLFRAVLLVPVWFVTTFIGAGVQVCAFFIWLIVLIAGRVPVALYEALAAVLRYQLRVYGYAAMLTSEYPRGLFGDKAPAVEAPAMADLRLDAPPDDVVAPTVAPRVTTLVLSKAGRRIVVLFLVLGVVFTVGTYGMALAGLDFTDAELEELEAEYDDLSSDAATFATEAQQCALHGAEGPQCLEEALLQFRDDVSDFQAVLGEIDVPQSSLGLAADLDDDATELVQLLDEMAAATDDQAAYAELGAEYQAALVQFDEDYAALHDSMLFS